MKLLRAARARARRAARSGDKRARFCSSSSSPAGWMRVVWVTLERRTKVGVWDGASTLRWACLASVSEVRRTVMATYSANPDDEDLQVFTNHLKTTAGVKGLPKCHICGQRRWQVLGMTAPPVVVDVNQDLGAAPYFAESGNTIPTYSLMCMNCFFIIQFAWLPIKSAVRR